VQLLRPPGRHRDAAGRLVFCLHLLFLMSPLYSTTGGRITTRIVAFTLTTTKLLRLKIWWTSVKGRCHGNQFCGTKRRQVGIRNRYCLCWHFTTFGKIANTIPIPRPPMNSLHLVKIRELCGVNTWDVVVCLQEVGGCTHSKILTHSFISPSWQPYLRLHCIVSTRMHGLVFAKLSTNIEGLFGFITKDPNCDGSLKGRCYGQRRIYGFWCPGQDFQTVPPSVTDRRTTVSS